MCHTLTFVLLLFLFFIPSPSFPSEVSGLPAPLPSSTPPPVTSLPPSSPPPSSPLSPCGGSRMHILIHRFTSRQRREWMAPCQRRELPWRSRAETAPVCWPLHHGEWWVREEKKQEDKGERRQKNTAERRGGGGRDGTSSLQKNSTLTPGQLREPPSVERGTARNGLERPGTAWNGPERPRRSASTCRSEGC